MWVAPAGILVTFTYPRYPGERGQSQGRAWDTTGGQGGRGQGTEGTLTQLGHQGHGDRGTLTPLGTQQPPQPPLCNEFTPPQVKGLLPVPVPARWGQGRTRDGDTERGWHNGGALGTRAGTGGQGSQEPKHSPMEGAGAMVHSPEEGSEPWKRRRTSTHEPGPPPQGPQASEPRIPSQPTLCGERGHPLSAGLGVLGGFGGGIRGSAHPPGSARPRTGPGSRARSASRPAPARSCSRSCAPRPGS